ncbi:hypothetical protein CCY99_02020 [Helicobacter sp. 16-1353]|uniref:bifunctional indole-3-glycerol phosphate synthase/phosphoribosylanthranilate isomerase n=1 Tax=Helicobacter sp. 16-1353 TaxID=2004996 RepID=UPI000DCE3400|nr:bifunctional indole-3-glycerol phosphate synthase/phosphoribosylanthranilate isomerase [Helicobacter sp. 16-1353]RAX54942.1 hypothetical protein CCY99_02020 [Helicobacter sp. 16-1353]
MNNVNDILATIIAQKRQDIAKMGFGLGSEIPLKRVRNIVPFMREKGTILEIKRASPSKGNIAINLNPLTLAQTYRESGTKNISVLTERNFFKGSLDDLQKVAKAMSDIAILRKDFIIFREEIRVSYLCGADAVLLIARILSKEELLSFSAECVKFGLTPFIEIASLECVEKLRYVASSLDSLDFADSPDSADSLDSADSVRDSAISSAQIVVGINSRDLRNFSIDTLKPSVYRNLLYQYKMGEKIVFESGIGSAEAAKFIAQRDFYGILVGESVAKNPDLAKSIVSSFLSNVLDSVESGDFVDSKDSLDLLDSLDSIDSAKFIESNKSQIPQSALFWEKIANIIYKRKIPNSPLIKICGITNINDALLAINADMLGFICSLKSPRNIDYEAIKQIKIELEKSTQKIPLFIGVITESNSKEGKTAIQLANDGIFDAIQYHNCSLEEYKNFTAKHPNIPIYAAKSLKNESDIESIKDFLHLGNPRILADSIKPGLDSANSTHLKDSAHPTDSTNLPDSTHSTSGIQINKNLVEKAKRLAPLWLAGGINVENIENIINAFKPELIDICSGLEQRPGVKDRDKIKLLFEKLK